MESASAAHRPAEDAAAGTGGDRRRDEPRGRQLPHLLEGHDLLQRAGTDRLPARLRPRPRRDPGRRSRRRPLHPVRRHRHGGDGGDLLQRPAVDVRHLRQAPLPEHLRSDPGGAGRRRGAGHAPRCSGSPSAPASTAASRCWSPSPSASTRRRGCCWCRSSASSPRSASPASASRWRRRSPRSTSSTTSPRSSSRPLFLVAGTFFPIDGLPEGVQVVAQLNPLHQLVELVRGGAFGYEAVDLARFAFLVAFALLTWRVAVSRMSASA